MILEHSETSVDLYLEAWNVGDVVLCRDLFANSQNHSPGRLWDMYLIYI